MIDMGSWKVIEADVLNDLHLDPNNVRLELAEDPPEADILVDLFRNEKALALVEGIIKVGYLTHETPIAIRRRRKLYVVEGNRRLAALKAIQNPYLVPEFQARISALTTGFNSHAALRKIEVKIAPKQADADQLIAALHAGNPRVAWSPVRQAKFFQAQIESGKGLKALKASYPLVDVEKYVLRSGLIEKFRSVRYSRPELVDFTRSRQFSTATLARIYESKQFIDLTGLGLTPDGDLKLKINNRVFGAMAELIVDGMLTGDLDTRTIGTKTAPRFKRLMAELRNIKDHGGKPPTASGDGDGQAGGGSGDSSAGSGSSNGSGGTGAGGKGPEGGRGSGGRGDSGRERRSQQFLNVERLVVPQGFPASIDRILQEFSTLDVDRYPNAAMDLLRTLLEKAIKAFADAKGKDLKRSGLNGYVYLANCLEWLEGWFVANGPKAEVQVVRRVRSNMPRNFHGSQDLLNAINHNHKIFATGNEVRTAWDAMRSLIEEMLK